MAMGAYHGKGNNGGGHREKGCPYGAMLLLAFAAALVGVMGLHKLRERRIHNLVLRDKDRELFSLHLLLQKEKEYAKEMAEKAEEMRAKMYSLRTQKMELDSRILEMQSTISSLKDEQRTMELALEEKRDEIKLLHEKEMDMGKRDLKESSLKEILKQKETEIEDLKRQLESLNLSTRESETKEELKKLEEKEKRGQLHESSENSTADKELEETWRKVDISEGTMLAEKEKLQGQGNVTEGSVQGEAAGEKDGFEAFGMNKGDSAGSQNKQNSVDKGETNGLNANSTANFAAGEVTGVDEGKAEAKKLEEKLKSERSGNSSGYSGSTVPRKLGDGKGGRSRGKRWRALARSRRLEKNRNSAMMKHRRFIEDAIEIIEGKQVGDNAANRQDQDMNMKKANKLDQVGSREKVSRDLNGDNQERKEDEHGFESRGEGEEILKEGKEQEQMSNPDQSNYGGVPTMGNLESGPGVPVNGRENRAAEVGIGGVGSRGGDATEDKINKDKDSGEAGATEEEVPDYPEEEARETDVKDSRESEMERAGDDFFKGGNVEEPREKEETDESEF